MEDTEYNVIERPAVLGLCSYLVLIWILHCAFSVFSWYDHLYYIIPIWFFYNLSLIPSTKLLDPIQLELYDDIVRILMNKERKPNDTKVLDVMVMSYIMDKSKANGL